MANYFIREEEGIVKGTSCAVLTPETISSINHPIKIAILKLLIQKPMYIVEIAKKLHIHEQNVYYHLEFMKPLIEVITEKKMRGTIAKQYGAKANAACLCLTDDLKPMSYASQTLTAHPFFHDFISAGILKATFVVGSPDPHGPFKSRARDGHYAVELACFLGKYARLPPHFLVSLDVDVDISSSKTPLIVVGGPVTNIVTSSLEKYLGATFEESSNWAIKTTKGRYHDDNIGIIARIPHPYNPQSYIIILAGVRYSGTKAAVIGLTRFTDIVLSRFTHQKKFYAIVQGFDLDGDGKLDSVELLE